MPRSTDRRLESCGARLHGRIERRTHTVLGIMSGTSMDGVDYALCRIGAEGVRWLDGWHRGFPAGLAVRIRAAAAGGLDAHAVGQLHHDLGRFYARGVRGRRVTCELVGLHGQTILHRPALPAPATFQLGEPAYLAAALEVPVVSNFRAADIAEGGQGAPLATAFHVRMFGAPGRHVAVQNLGGIGNVTSIDWRRAAAAPRVLAFDTGPGNALVDLAIERLTAGRRRFDQDGVTARGGRADMDWVTRWLGDPFFRKRPPKSTGRERFGEAWFAREWDPVLAGLGSGTDAVATVAELTVASVVESYRRYLPAVPERVIVAGGGARNGYFMARLRTELRRLRPDAEVVSSEKWGWGLSWIEPAAFAWLAWLRWHRLPGNLPATTGARRAVLLGQICDGSRVHEKDI